MLVPRNDMLGSFQIVSLELYTYTISTVGLPTKDSARKRLASLYRLV